MEETLRYLQVLRKTGYACSGNPGCCNPQAGPLQAPNTFRVWQYDQHELFAKMAELGEQPEYADMSLLIRLLDAVALLCSQSPLVE